jgi:hypothetical protein
MKRSFLILVAFLVLSTSFSQDILKGPAAKNAKLGKTSSSKTSFVFDNRPTLNKGPAAKNVKVWNKEGSTVAIRTRRVINNPKGLQAKNRKVWEESGTNLVDSKASYKLPKSIRKRKIWWH